MDPSSLHPGRDASSDSAALLELSSVLNASHDLPFILGNVLLTAMGKMMVSRAVVLTSLSGPDAPGEPRRYRVSIAKGFATERLGSEHALPTGWTAPLAVDAIENDPDPAVGAFARCCRDCRIATLHPMVLDGVMVGLIALGRPHGGRAWSQADLLFLESVAAVAATAVRNALAIGELRDANRRLDGKVQELNSLFELSREMNATFDEQRVLRVLGYTLMGQLRVRRYAVFAAGPDGFRPIAAQLPGFSPRVRHQRSLRAMRSTVHFTPARPPATAAERWLHGLGMQLLVPMRHQDETRGLLCIGDRLGGAAYDQAECAYLEALAAIAIAALENIRLLRETVEMQRLEKELSLARSIQKGLLPAVIPEPPEYAIAAANESSQHVGGDYYDIVAVSDHEYLLAIGDVSGKGIPASLLMANVQAALRTLAPLRLPLGDATARLNALVYENTGADKFITFFWGVLDARAHTFTYVNAGHNPPFLVSSDGAVRPLSTGGLILGVLPEVPPYDTECVALRPGDLLAAYTDGVNEAMSATMAEFGMERLEALLVAVRRAHPREVIARVIDALREHSRGAPQSDDITMLVLRRDCVTPDASRALFPRA
jgi:sigma-B regulation protein RsbU (phosphoserine phosphatase)